MRFKVEWRHGNINRTTGTLEIEAKTQKQAEKKTRHLVKTLYPAFRIYNIKVINITELNLTE